MRIDARALLLALAASAAVPACAQTAGDPAEGYLYAHQVCAECHGVDPGNVASPNPSAPAFQTVVSTPGMTDMALVVWLHTPHQTMPSISIESTDLENLLAYMASLRGEP